MGTIRPSPLAPMADHVTSGSIFDDLGRPADEADHLKARAALLGQLVQALRNDGCIDPAAAASRLGIDVSRADLVVTGRLSRFTEDDLRTLLSRIETHPTHAD